MLDDAVCRAGCPPPELRHEGKAEKKKKAIACDVREACNTLKIFLRDF